MLNLPFVDNLSKIPKGAIFGSTLDELAFKLYGEHGHVQEMLEIAEKHAGRPLKFRKRSQQQTTAKASRKPKLPKR